MSGTLRPRIACLISALVTACPLYVADGRAELPTVIDIGLQTGFQDLYFGSLKHGRACVAADFNLDGRVDFYIGNPSDESFVIENVPTENGPIFMPAQVLLTGFPAWGAAAGDYDNDGDYDLFVTGGGNEGTSFCHLFRNNWVETEVLTFDNVTLQAGVMGGVPEGDVFPVAAQYANAVWVDYDNDGFTDVFVNVNQNEANAPVGSELLRNILWRNDGDGTFTDVTLAVGLTSAERTRHSTFFDADNDGDMDLFENNWRASNFLWKNMLQETGAATFVDATAEFSGPDQHIGDIYNTFASATSDFNNDGWQDLILFVRAIDDLPDEPIYFNGHVMLVNEPGVGFVDVTLLTDINLAFIGNENGVMGCQIGDLNNDGIDDLFYGNGGPPVGEVNGLVISNADLSPIGSVPLYEDATSTIDFPAPEWDTFVYPAYPYRTHGSAIADVDNDGGQELMVTNGGMMISGTDVEEPNRLFRFTWTDPANYIKVRPVGNGTTVSRDAIGTRISVEVGVAEGPSWTVHRTLTGGSAFSAQNGFDLHFGLRNATTVKKLSVKWPDGEVTEITDGLAVNTTIIVTRNDAGDTDADEDVDLDDYAVFESCLQLESEESVPVECYDVDADLNGQIDLADFAALQTAFGVES